MSVPADDAPARDAVLDKSAADDTAADHPVVGGNNLVTSNGARVDSVESDNNPADKEDNASATTRVRQPTPGARYWRAPGTTTRICPGAAYHAARRIRPSAVPGHTTTIRLDVVHNNTVWDSAINDTTG